MPCTAAASLPRWRAATDAPRRHGIASAGRLLTVLAAAAVPMLAEAASVLRYRCNLPDGTTRLVMQDLSEFSSVGACQSVRVTVPDEPVARGWVPSGAAPVVRTIELRAPWQQAKRQPAEPPLELAGWIDSISRRHGVNPALTQAVMYVESRYRANARSPKGAVGLMQVMPATGSRYGVATAERLKEPQANIDVGVRYLRDLLAMFPGRIDLAVAAYNAGEGAVMKHGRRVPPYAETQAYVKAVLERLGAWHLQ